MSKDVFRLQELYKTYYLFLEATFFQIPLFRKQVWTDSFFLKKNFMNPFYGWDSAAWRLGSLRGCSLLFTNKFPEVPGTYWPLVYIFVAQWPGQTFSQKLSTRALGALGGSPINKHFDKPTSIKLDSCKWPLPLTLESFLTIISVPPFTRFVVSISVVGEHYRPRPPPHWSWHVVYEIGKHVITS